MYLIEPAKNGWTVREYSLANFDRGSVVWVASSPEELGKLIVELTGGVERKNASGG